MAVDAFLKLDGIDGESTDKGHEKWIQIESFSWGASNTASLGSGGAGAGKAVPSDFSFVFPQSAASPEIFIKLLEGRELGFAQLSMRKAGGEQQDFLKIKLSDVLISSYNVEGGGDSPMESIALKFVKIDFSYSPQDASGRLGPEILESFDFAALKSG